MMFTVENSKGYKVIDGDTQDKIECVVWLDSDRCSLEMYAVDSYGHIVIDRANNTAVRERLSFASARVDLIDKVITVFGVKPCSIVAAKPAPRGVLNTTP